MSLPRIVHLGPSRPVPVVNDNTGEVTHWTDAAGDALLAQPTDAQWTAARAAQAADPSGRAWLPYFPAYTRDLTDEWGNAWVGEPELPLWIAKWPAWAGAGAFFKTDEAAAADAIKRAGGNPSLEYITADVEDPKGGDRDYQRTLYVREGDLYRPLASYHRYEASSWVQFRDADLPMIAAVALAVAGGPMVNAIGKAVVGPSLAAAYPALPGVVGNVALQTAMNGGDIAAAVQNAALGMVGAQAGALAGGGAIGAATSAATTAALKGGDLKTAVASSLLSYGVKNVDFADFFSTDPGAFNQPQPLDMVDWGADPLAANFTPTMQTMADPIGGGDLFGPPEPASWELTDWQSVNPQPGEYTTDANTLGIDAPQYSYSDNPAPAIPTDASGGGFLVDLTNAALAVIKVNAAYQATQRPPIRTATQTGTLTRTPNADGTVTVRNTQTGQVTKGMPEKGVPYAMANGSTIINNGNGTFTTIRPDGTSITSSYGGGASSGLSAIPPMYLYGGGALLALLLLTKRGA